jgi:plastocyanin
MIAPVIRRSLLGLAWLAVCGLGAPGVLVAEDLVPLTTPTPAQAPATTAPAEPAPAAPAAAPETTTAPQPALAQPAPAATPAPVAEPAPAPAPKKDAKPVARKSAAGSVQIKDFKFAPATVTVNVGDTVTWTNADTAPHNAKANDGSFGTSDLSKGKSGSATISKAGTFAYICSIHPSMKGTVKAVAASSGSDDGAADDTPSDSGTAGDSTDTTAGGEELANTGAEPGWIFAAGIGLLLIGLTGRRSARST